MKNFKTLLSAFLVGIAFLSFSTEGLAQTSLEDNVTIIELTQVPGEFNTKALNLKPGKYQFKIINQSVDKEVGFVIQKAEDASKDVMKTAVPNSFASKMIMKGDAAYTGVVDLTEGSYVYSCPLNPTPHYKIVVD